MRQSLILAVLSLSMFFLPHSVRADDKVNQAFDAWSKFAVGSSQTLEGTMDLGHGPVTSTSTTKLIEKADDHLVIETSGSMVMAGQTRALPPQQTTVLSAVDPSKEMLEQGSEDITAAGKTFSCKIYVPAHPKPESKLQIKMWASPDVPGGVVKMEIQTSNGKIVQMLKSFEVK